MSQNEATEDNKRALRLLAEQERRVKGMRADLREAEEELSARRGAAIAALRDMGTSEVTLGEEFGDECGAKVKVSHKPKWSLRADQRNDLVTFLLDVAPSTVTVNPKSLTSFAENAANDEEKSRLRTLCHVHRVEEIRTNLRR